MLTFPPPEGLWIRDVRYFRRKTYPERNQTVAAAGGFFHMLIEGQRVAAYPLPR